MDDIENKLGAILGDPQMMAKIMSMAQQLGGGPPEPPPPPPPPKEAPPMNLQGLDIGALTKIAGLASAAGIDKNEKALLGALSAYLSNERISKLEKAMRAAKLAGIASTFLGSGILSRTDR